MDASDTRRGRPATHRAFEAEHRAAGLARRPRAVRRRRRDPARRPAAGLGRGHAAPLRLPAPTTSLPGLTVFEQCRTEVIAGQFLDVSVQARGRADVDTAMTVLRYKSAKYSIERPLHIGAALAGATPGQLEQLSRFGLPLGEAFQLRDDLLGVFGDPATTGKPAGDDLVEGKRTVLVALALDAAPRADAPSASTPRSARRSTRPTSTSCAASSTAPARARRSRRSSAQLAERAVAALGHRRPSTTHARGVLAELAAAATQRTV